ncbi:MAG: hypothetical protein ACI9WU_004950 [Myxococcota bacterium]|jgi:hypothetical protein
MSRDRVQRQKRRLQQDRQREETAARRELVLAQLRGLGTPYALKAASRPGLGADQLDMILADARRGRGGGGGIAADLPGGADRAAEVVRSGTWPATDEPTILDSSPERAERTAELVASLAPALGLSASGLTIDVGDEAQARTSAQGARGLMADGVVYLSPTAYDPRTSSGRWLLGHEVTHAAQRVLPGLQAGSPAAAETEASARGRDFAAGRAVMAPEVALSPLAVAANEPGGEHDPGERDQSELNKPEKKAATNGAKAPAAAVEDKEAAEIAADGAKGTDRDAAAKASEAGVFPTNAQIEANVARDLKLSESTTPYIFMNQPGFIGGVGYQKKRMQAVINHLKKAHKVVVDGAAYKAWEKKKDDAALTATLQADIQAAEVPHGAAARALVVKYWEARKKKDPTPILQPGKDLEGLEKKLGDAETSVFAGVDDKAEQVELVDHTARSRELAEIEAALAKIGKSVLAGVYGSRTQRRALNRSVSKANKAVASARKAVKAKLKAAEVSTLAERLTAARKALTEARKLVVERAKAVADPVVKYNEDVARAVTFVGDVALVPALVIAPAKRATVTINGRRMTFKTHHHSRMAYYGDVYIPTGYGLPRTAGTKATRKNEVRTKMYEYVQKFGTTSDAKVLASIAVGEGDFHTVQTIDRVRVSWGLVQFQGSTFVQALRNVESGDAAFFKSHFEAHGITFAKKGRTPAATKRTGREVAGADRSQPSSEARGVDSLMVYDHAASVWVTGNDALEVMQKDPRYQALLADAGTREEGKSAQMKVAMKEYLKRGLNTRLTFGKGGGKVTLRVREIFKSEVSIFGLTDRMVHTGNVKWAGKMLVQYMAQVNKERVAARKKQEAEAAEKRAASGDATPVEALPPVTKMSAVDLKSVDQSHLAAFFKKYTGGPAIRWHLIDDAGLKASGVPKASDSSYTF